ncbi:hypothetical protein [Sorangium sp. So ce145]|uniref:hypothetical protein n=1 Tax=Sorangium sp. So ce145 TaxID=3133285 RepID=UPI003F6111A6
MTPPCRGIAAAGSLLGALTFLGARGALLSWFLARAGREADARAAFAEARPLLPSGLSFARRFAALGIDG